MIHSKEESIKNLYFHSKTTPFNCILMINEYYLCLFLEIKVVIYFYLVEIILIRPNLSSLFLKNLKVISFHYIIYSSFVSVH